MAQILGCRAVLLVGQVVVAVALRVVLGARQLLRVVGEATLVERGIAACPLLSVAAVAVVRLPLVVAVRLVVMVVPVWCGLRVVQRITPVVVVVGRLGLLVLAVLAVVAMVLMALRWRNLAQRIRVAVVAGPAVRLVRLALVVRVL